MRVWTKRTEIVGIVQFIGTRARFPMRTVQLGWSTTTSAVVTRSNLVVKVGLLSMLLIALTLTATGAPPLSRFKDFVEELIDLLRLRSLVILRSKRGSVFREVQVRALMSGASKMKIIGMGTRATIVPSSECAIRMGRLKKG